MNNFFLKKAFISFKKDFKRNQLKNHLRKVKKNPSIEENYKIPISFITHIDLEPIAACNLKCSFCQVPGWQRAKSTSPLSLNLFNEILDQLPGLMTVKLQGMGEPFLNPRLAEMIKACSDRNLYTSITSNGTLLNKKKSQAILEAGLSDIVFSFDGAKKDTYEKARDGANFDMVRKNIKELTSIRDKNNYKTAIRMDCLASNQNIFEEIPELVHLSADLGVDRLHVKARLKVWENTSESNNEEHFNVKENIYLDEMKNYKKVINLAKKNAETRNIKFTMGSLDDDIYSFENPCMWPWTSLYIGTDGKIVPCCVVGVPETWNMGDITVQSIDQIWNNESYLNLRKNLIKGDIPETCKPCYGNKL